MSMARTPGTRSNISSLFIFLLVGLFALLSLLSVLIGVGVYRNVVENVAANEQIRTSLSYVANKVRAADRVGAIEVAEWNGLETLLLREEYDGSPYETRIYCLQQEDGRNGLYEQFVHEGDIWDVANGQYIMEIQELSFSQEDDKVYMELKTAQGELLTLHLQQRSAE